ncbi:MAG: hypothetical protein IH861_09185 [Chloroflexi bacterium]|nr:hypothetical protein [Chloroflexota bacterium]
MRRSRLQIWNLIAQRPVDILENAPTIQAAIMTTATAISVATGKEAPATPTARAVAQAVPTPVSTSTPHPTATVTPPLGRGRRYFRWLLRLPVSLLWNLRRHLWLKEQAV